MLDLSFAAQSSALGAHRPTNTLGKVVCRISSAPARCDGRTETAKIANKIAETVRIIVNPRFQRALSRHRYCGAAERTRGRDCARRPPRRASERRKRESGSTARRRSLQLIERTTAQFDKGVRDIAVMQEADDDLLKRVEDKQQQQKYQRPVQR